MGTEEEEWGERGQEEGWSRKRRAVRGDRQEEWGEEE